MKKAIFIFLTLIFILNITPVLADDDFERECKTGLFGGGDVCYKPEVAIPGFPNYEFKVKSNTLGLYINSLYDYFLYAAGVLAVIVIMIAGFQWITAGGNQSKIGEAKERITSAIIGLFLALGSYLLLFTINPDLVNIGDLNMISIKPIDHYCIEGQMVREQGNTGGYNIKGEEAECGKNYEYQIDGVDFQCKGVYVVGNNLCYDGVASSPEDVCIALGRIEYNAAPKVGEINTIIGTNRWFATGAVNGTWMGNISSFDEIISSQKTVKGYCWKFTYYKNGINYFAWDYVDPDTVALWTQYLNTEGIPCSSINVEDGQQLLACWRSSKCKATTLGTAGNVLSTMSTLLPVFQPINNLVGHETKCKSR